ncbi:MAG TPA: two-component regulator propeller domain-containing protein [Candidatus Binatia bacterium]|nr:two-component regulator propeller domain-containing protein [Candidatus Binatia bacterium]
MKNGFSTSPLLFCLLFLFGSQVAHAQYRFDRWTADNGLPQNSVRDIVQTRDGYLWLTTFDGLVRFDGVRFTVFNKSNSPAILTNRFVSLFEDGQGDLWASTESGGLTRLHQGRLGIAMAALTLMRSSSVPFSLCLDVNRLCGQTKNRDQRQGQAIVSSVRHRR